jgi:hypothetical protein
MFSEVVNQYLLTFHGAGAGAKHYLTKQGRYLKILVTSANSTCIIYGGEACNLRLGRGYAKAFGPTNGLNFLFGHNMIITVSVPIYKQNNSIFFFKL